MEIILVISQLIVISGYDKIKSYRMY
jgi:hypothetical protein